MLGLKTARFTIGNNALELVLKLKDITDDDFNGNNGHVDEKFLNVGCESNLEGYFIEFYGLPFKDLYRKIVEECYKNPRYRNFHIHVIEIEDNDFVISVAYDEY